MRTWLWFGTVVNVVLFFPALLILVATVAVVAPGSPSFGVRLGMFILSGTFAASCIISPGRAWRAYDAAHYKTAAAWIAAPTGFASLWAITIAWPYISN